MKPDTITLKEAEKVIHASNVRILCDRLVDDIDELVTELDDGESLIADELIDLTDKLNETIMKLTRNDSYYRFLTALYSRPEGD